MSKSPKTFTQMVVSPKAYETWNSIEMKDRQIQRMNVVGNLMYGLAHDFHNILTTILTCTEMANVSQPYDSGPRLQGVTKAAKRGRQLVQQVLLFGSQREKKPQPINLALVIQETVSLLRYSLPKKITIDSDRAVQPSFVLADSVQMSQILMNLCLNGAQSMSAGGVLEISLSDVKMYSESMKDYPDLTPGPFVRLRVRDSGEGIPPHQIKRIFDPFFTTKKSGEGTGMGLAVVQDIVTRHYGMISVESVLGEGAIFDIYLPQIPEVFHKQAVEAPVVGGNTCQVLEDHASPIHGYV